MIGDVLPARVLAGADRAGLSLATSASAGVRERAGWLEGVAVLRAALLRRAALVCLRLRLTRCCHIHPVVSRVVK